MFASKHSDAGGLGMPATLTPDEGRSGGPISLHNVIISGFGPKAVRLAAEIWDGYVNIGPDAELMELFRSSGGVTRESGGDFLERIFSGATGLAGAPGGA